MSITWITLTSLIFLVIMFWTHVWSPVSSFGEPQVRPFSGQRRTCYLWEFDPAKHQTLLELFGTTHEDIWKVLFKAGETPPPMTEDRGLSLKRQANSVSCFMFSRHTLY